MKKKDIAKKMSKDGFDGNKRWGNSAVKGVGVNSPAMMKARKGFQSLNRASGRNEGEKNYLGRNEQARA